MRPSLPDTTAPAAAPQDDDVTVEAATAADAIAEVHERLGADARIVQAEKVLRGGLWGFFPKQMVQLTARPAPPAPAAATAPRHDETPAAPTPSQPTRVVSTPSPPAPAASTSAPPAPEASSGLEGVLAWLSSQEDDAEEGLGTALRRHLGVRIEEDAPDRPAAESGWRPPSAPAFGHRLSPVAGGEPSETPTGIAAALATIERATATSEEPARIPATVAPAPATVTSAPAPAPAPERPASPRAEPRPGPIARELPLEDVEYTRPSGGPWSGRGLLMLGLPRSMVDAVLAQEPADDAAWTYAVARALTPLCRPLPTGPAAIVGPRAEKLSRALGTPLVRLAEAPQGRSTFAVACTDSLRARTWLATHRDSRWTHLVVGGAGWRGLLFDGPLAVSWVGDDALGEAIRTAHDLGMVLGPGVRGAGAVVDPAPIELAMLLRDMLGGR